MIWDIILDKMKKEIFKQVKRNLEKIVSFKKDTGLRLNIKDKSVLVSILNI